LKIAPEEHEFLYDQSDKLMQLDAKPSTLELGTSISTSLKMIQYSNDKIIENDLLGNFRRNKESNNGFQEGMLAITGQSHLAIKDSEKKKEEKPSKLFFCSLIIRDFLR
jgi:hypothetical protein